MLSSDGQSWPAAAADVFTLGILSPSVVGAAYSVEFKRLPQVPTSDSFTLPRTHFGPEGVTSATYQWKSQNAGPLFTTGSALIPRIQ